MRRLLTFLGIAIAACLLVIGVRSILPASQAKTSLTVSAAASLQPALEEIKPRYQQSKSNAEMSYNFGASGALLQQIQQGAPVDVFISASKRQMDALSQAKQLIPETQTNLVKNRLVLITPKAKPLTRLEQLGDANIKRVAIGEPRSVPAGQYAEQVLKNVGIYNQVKPKFVLSNNVRQVLAAVESGNVDAGFVYITDAKSSDQVSVAVTIEESLHDPIVYPIAVLQRTKNASVAREFVQYLTSEDAKSVFRKYGFSV